MKDALSHTLVFLTHAFYITKAIDHVSLSISATANDDHDIDNYDDELTEAVTRRCSVKKVFLKISGNSQKKPVPESLFLIKLQASASGTGVFL